MLSKCRYIDIPYVFFRSYVDPQSGKKGRGPAKYGNTDSRHGDSYLQIYIITILLQFGGESLERSSTVHLKPSLFQSVSHL